MTIKIGDKVKTINFGWAEAITDSYTIEGKASRGGLVDVKFDDTGNIRKAVYGATFKLGCMRDGNLDVVVREGSVFKTLNDGYVIVQKVNGPRDIEIKFVNTDNLYKAQKDQLLSGFVKDKPKEVAKIDAEEAARALATEVREAAWKVSRDKQLLKDSLRKLELECREAALAQLKIDNYNKWVLKQEADKVRQERNTFLIAQSLTYEIVDNNQHKATDGVLDIDFKDRQGLWVLRFQMNGCFIQTRLGKLHNNMTQRANIGGSYQDKFTKSYVGVSASKIFSNPQKFCDWAVQQVGWGLGYHLDKDLLIEGNREYSEKACCFLPGKINSALVYRTKSTVSKRTGLFKSYGTLNGEVINFGNYESEDEAIEVCQTFKRNMLTKYANEFKENISEAAYERLTNF